MLAVLRSALPRPSQVQRPLQGAGHRPKARRLPVHRRGQQVGPPEHGFDH